MTRKQIITLVDDTDGTEAAETVRFSLDKHDYEIDLSAFNAEAFRKALADFVANARRLPAVTVKGKKPPAPSNRTIAIRAWAKARGITLNDRGRIPADVTAKYELDTLARPPAGSPDGRNAQSPAEPPAPARFREPGVSPDSPAEPATAPDAAGSGPLPKRDRTRPAHKPGRAGSPAGSSEPASPAGSPAEPATAPDGAGSGQAPNGNRNSVIRAWAKLHGIPVNDRGRIPADVQAKYDTAHGEG